MKGNVEFHSELINDGSRAGDTTLVAQGNQLIEGSYDITLAEIRLLWLALTKIDSKKPQPRSSEIVLTAPEYSSTYGVDLANAAHQLQAVSESLGSKPIYTYEYNSQKNRMDTVLRFWFSQIAYGSANGADVTLSFSDKVTPFLYDLKNEFTQMNVFTMAKLDSPFAFRLYSWLNRYRYFDKYRNPKSGVIRTENISIDWMKERAGLAGKYADFKNFRVRVLDPAVNAINRTTDLTVRYETVTAVRKVTHIVFSYIVEGDKAYIRVKPEPPKLPRRPRVKKGSHSEGEWAKSCLDKIRDYENKLKDYDTKEELPIKFLRKQILYYEIIGNRDAVNYIENCIAERKNKKSNKSEED
ncbi:TPA: replication initiation protein [Escherichia coli]|nr:replication initiation protein [Escherichia coli]HCL6287090.1 replication initiation protein [Escherichia coli]